MAASREEGTGFQASGFAGLIVADDGANVRGDVGGERREGSVEEGVGCRGCSECR